MDQLTILANLSELRLLRDLADVAKRREAISQIESEDLAIRRSLATEAASSSPSPAGDHITARTFAAYAENTRKRLATLSRQRLAAETLAASALKNALHAQGRARAIELLQKRATLERQTTTARREETLSMSCQATLLPKDSTDT